MGHDSQFERCVFLLRLLGVLPTCPSQRAPSATALPAAPSCVLPSCMADTPVPGRSARCHWVNLPALSIKLLARMTWSPPGQGSTVSLWSVTACSVSARGCRQNRSCHGDSGMATSRKMANAACPTMADDIKQNKFKFTNSSIQKRLIQTPAVSIRDSLHSCVYCQIAHLHFA